MINNEKLLDELYMLTLIEEERELLKSEEKRYIEIYNFCQSNNINIPFGVNI